MIDVAPEHLPRDQCEGCPFGGPKVGSKGDHTSPLVMIGESPGANEVRTKKPFAGESGTIIHTFIPEQDALWLNAMECSPHKRAKDERTLNYAARNCHDRLEEIIQRHPRRLLVAMGNPAVRSLTGDYGLKITQIRGQLIPSTLSELGILPVVHPAALMRGTGNFRQFREDLEYAKELIETGQPRHYEPPTFEVLRWPHTYAFDRAIEHLWGSLKHNITPELTCDIETSGFSHINDRILSIGITDEASGHVYCFPPTPSVLKHLKPLFESTQIRWNWHNGKFDVKFLRMAGINARVDDDTMLMSYALDEQRGVHDLETVAQDVLDAPDYKHMVREYLPRKDSSYELIPLPVLYEYMSIDVGNTGKIRPIYRKRVARDKALNKLYTKTLIPASEMLSHVEANGMHVDASWIDDVDVYLRGDLEALTSEIQEICGRSVNPNSPPQMSEVLFKQFKLPNRKQGSTDKDVLKKLSENPATRHPVVLALSKHRKVAKAWGTYVKGMRKHIHLDGRIYPTFLIHGTITGRLACRDPNLQNIPRDSIIRGLFDAPDDCELVDVDLSQAELRSLATLSGDPIMIALYQEGRSIHKELAVHLFGEGYNLEQYTKCKNVNFGIIYGITEYGLMEQINDTVGVAREMLQGWHDRFPVAWEFIEKCRRTPARHQTITTCFGRKKRVHLVTRGNIRFLQNEAANFPHQSIASDITLHAAIRKEPELRKMGVRVVNLVHDSIIMEVPRKDPEFKYEVARLVGKEMEQVPRDWGLTKIPFVAEGAYGDRWGKDNMTEFGLEDYKEAA